MILSPSILAADFGILAEQIKKVESTGVKWLHIDVMDGHFVKNISFAMPVIKSIRKYTDLFFDVHLMISSPEEYIDAIIDSGADGVTFHIEAVDKPYECIEKIRKRGKFAGISFSPDTPVDAVLPYINDVDMILAMTVYPGLGGQKYIERVNDKIKALRAATGEDFLIQVDGGVTQDNIDSILEAGANVIVAGTCVFEGDIEKNIKGLLR